MKMDDRRRGREPFALLADIDERRRAETVHLDHLRRVTQIISKAIVLVEPDEIEERIRRCDGVYRWMDVRTVPLRNSASMRSTSRLSGITTTPALPPQVGCGSSDVEGARETARGASQVTARRRALFGTREFTPESRAPS